MTQIVEQLRWENFGVYRGMARHTIGVEVRVA